MRVNPNEDKDLIARFREATKNLSPNRIAKDVGLDLSTAKRLKKSPPKRVSTDNRLLMLRYLGEDEGGGVTKGQVPRETPDLTRQVLGRLYEVALGWTPEERAELDRLVSRGLNGEPVPAKGATALSANERVQRAQEAGIVRRKAEENDNDDRNRRIELGDRSEPKNKTRKRPQSVRGNLGG